MSRPHKNLRAEAAPMRTLREVSGILSTRVRQSSPPEAITSMSLENKVPCSKYPTQSGAQRQWTEGFGKSGMAAPSCSTPSKPEQKSKYLSLAGSQWPSCAQPSGPISRTFPNFGHEFDSRYPLIQILLGRQCDLPTLGNPRC